MIQTLCSLFSNINIAEKTQQFCTTRICSVCTFSVLKSFGQINCALSKILFILFVLAEHFVQIYHFTINSITYCINLFYVFIFVLLKLKA